MRTTPTDQYQAATEEWNREVSELAAQYVREGERPLDARTRAEAAISARRREEARRQRASYREPFKEWSTSRESTER